MKNKVSVKPKIKYLVILFLALISLINTGFSVRNSRNFTPPGTVFITEVLNKHWAEYLSHQKNEFGENSEKYLAALPDTLVWKSVYSGDIERHFSDVANFPVIGITYEQTVNYCTWRSERVYEKYKQVLAIVCQVRMNGVKFPCFYP